MKQIIQQELIAHQQTAQAMDALTDAIEVAAKLCIDALKNGNITDVYSIDRSVTHYLVYSKKCTIVYGK